MNRGSVIRLMMKIQSMATSSFVVGVAAYSAAVKRRDEAPPRHTRGLWFVLLPDPGTATVSAQSRKRLHSRPLAEVLVWHCRFAPAHHWRPC